MSRKFFGVAPAALRASAFLLAFTLAPAASAQPAKQRDDLLRVSFIDVGQGDAIWIQGPKRHDGKPGINVLIDGGPLPSANEGHLVDYLKAYNFAPGSVVDYMIATHPHDDHFPGLVAVLNGYDVRTVIDAGFPKPETSGGQPTPYGLFMTAVRKKTASGKTKLIEMHDQQRGTVALDWQDDSAAAGTPNIHAEILAGFFAGQETFGDKQNTKENNCSTVIRLEYGEISFIFMGDAEGKDRHAKPDTADFVERALLEAFKGHPEKLAASVLKVGHHGSETSSTNPFIKAVHPDVLVVMSGRKNFGSVYLPDPSVLKRYQSQLPKITILRTDQGDEAAHLGTGNDADGDHIYMYSDGDSLRVYQAQKLSGKWKWVLVRVVTPPSHADPG